MIAAVIFGGWTLRGTIAGCFLFGGADALRLALPALGYQLNPQLSIAAPYAAPLIVMCLFADRGAANPRRCATLHPRDRLTRRNVAANFRHVFATRGVGYRAAVEDTISARAGGAVRGGLIR